VGPVTRFAAPPGPAKVFDLDLDLLGAGVATDGKGAASRLGMQDCVGRQLVGYEHDVVGDLTADLAEFLRLSVERPCVPGADLRCDHVCGSFPAGIPAGSRLAAWHGMQS
jgi:hypothetical protein